MCLSRSLKYDIDDRKTSIMHRVKAAYNIFSSKNHDYPR